MPKWVYKGKEIESLEDVKNLENIKDILSLYGFIYELTYDDGKKYIGKKNFYGVKELKARMSKLPRPGHITFLNHIKKHKRVEYEQFQQETDWLTYEGSNNYKNFHKIVSKEILQIATSKRYLTYLEAKHLFIKNGIEDENYVNENILGRFFRGNLASNPKQDYLEFNQYG